MLLFPNKSKEVKANEIKRWLKDYSKVYASLKVAHLIRKIHQYVFSEYDFIIDSDSFKYK